MSETAWPERYWQDARWLAACFALVLVVAFSPFLVGPFTLLTSAGDAPSVYGPGASTTPLPARPLKEVDPGAPAWASEPWLQVEHDTMFVDHRIPWWNPYDGYGQPFAASQQSQPFFPLTLLASLHPSPRVWDAYIVARLFAAGFFAGLFVLFYGGRWGALAAAVATAFAGYYQIYYSMPHLSVETLIPAVLWATEWLVRRPSLAATAGLAAVIGALHLGGMPESAMVATLAGVLYLAVRLRTSEPTATPYARVGLFVAANFAGAAVGGAMIVPFLDYLRYSFDTHRVTAGAPPIGTAYFSDAFGREVFQRLVPLAYGPPLNAVTEVGFNGYSHLRGWFGTTVAFGALIALLGQLRSRVERTAEWGAAVALATVGALALAKSLGAPWINWIGGLPVLRLVGFAKYNEPVIDVCAAMLCGLGIAAFERGRRPPRWAVLGAAALVAIALVQGYVGALEAVPSTPHAVFLYASTAFAVGLATLALALAARNAAGTRVAAGLAAIVIVEAIGNYYVPMYFSIAALTPATRNPYAGAPFVGALQATDRDYSRVMGIGGPLWPNWAGAMRLDDPETLNAMYPARYFDFIDTFLKPQRKEAWEDLRDRFDASSDPSLSTPLARRWLTLSSVRYVLFPAERRLSDPHLAEIYHRDVNIYAYDDPLPRASIFHSTRAASDQDALRILADPRTDVHRTLVVADTPGAAGQLVPSADAGPETEGARIAKRDASSVTIEAVLRRTGFVMLNDTFAPGWVATVDGAPVAIVRADVLFRAVLVPAGRHTIVFAYRSLADTVGMTLTLAGLAALAGCAWSLRRVRRGGHQKRPAL